MTDIEVLTIMDRALIEQGIIDPGFSDACLPVHEIMRQFRAETGRNFSTADLQHGEKYLRRWLRKIRDEGASEAKLITMLRSGLGHLCYDFIEFTYEMIGPEEIVRKAILSFKNRNYHTAVFETPSAGGAGRRSSGASSRKTPSSGKRGAKKTASRKKKSSKKIL